MYDPMTHAPGSLGKLADKLGFHSIRPTIPRTAGVRKADLELCGRVARLPDPRHLYVRDYKECSRGAIVWACAERHAFTGHRPGTARSTDGLVGVGRPVSIPRLTSKAVTR